MWRPAWASFSRPPARPPVLSHGLAARPPNPPLRPPQASIEETNRIRALLGLKPLAGTTAPAAAADDGPPPVTAADGPLLGPEIPAAAAAAAADAAAQASRAQRAAPDESAGAKEVMALELSRYTSARPRW